MSQKEKEKTSYTLQEVNELLKEKEESTELTQSQEELIKEIEAAKLELKKPDEKSKVFLVSHKYKNLEQKVRYFLAKWHLEPEDILVMENDVIFIKKSGWFRLALEVVVKTELELLFRDFEKGIFIVQATVYVQEKSYADFGMCSTLNEGKKTLAIGLQTATSRAKIRAIQQAVPLPASSVDELESEKELLYNPAIDAKVKQVFEKADKDQQKKEEKKEKQVEKMVKELANIDKILESEDPMQKAKKDLEATAKEIPGPNDDLKNYLFMPCVLQHEFELSWEIRTNTNRVFMIPKKFLKIMDPKTDGGCWILKDYVPEMTKPKTDELGSYTETAQVPNVAPIFEKVINKKVKETKRAEK